jgi:hypothetical protein
MASDPTEADRARQILWLSHGHTALLYGDDGEMQCGVFDFKRDPFERLLLHVTDTARAEGRRERDEAESYRGPEYPDLRYELSKRFGGLGTNYLLAEIDTTIGKLADAEAECAKLRMQLSGYINGPMREAIDDGEKLRAELSKLSEQINRWEAKEVNRGSCCADMEAERDRLREDRDRLAGMLRELVEKHDSLCTAHCPEWDRARALVTK